MAEVKMIVGLGNPGPEYEGSRHNIGFEVADFLAGRFNCSLKAKKFGAILGDFRLRDRKVVLLKPVRFMNNSGQVVATALGFYKLQLPDMIVVTDDMALEVPRIRIRATGSAGGHNGLAKRSREAFMSLRNRRG